MAATYSELGAGAQAVAKIGSAIVSTISSTNSSSKNNNNDTFRTSEEKAPLRFDPRVPPQFLMPIASSLTDRR